MGPGDAAPVPDWRGALEPGWGLTGGRAGGRRCTPGGWELKAFGEARFWVVITLWHVRGA